MNKQEFIYALKGKLKKLPKKEVAERLNFYSEMIDDRMEEGLSEEDAVAAIGSADEIARSIYKEISPDQTAAKQKSKKASVTKNILLIAGSPVWLSLLISALAVVFSAWASMWAVVISFWAAFFSFAVSAPAGILLTLSNLFSAYGYAAAFFFCCSLTCASLAIFSFLGCKRLTDYALIFTKKGALAIKNFFSGKENE